MRACSRCRAVKADNEFYKGKNGRPVSACKKCYSQRYYWANREKKLAYERAKSPPKRRGDCEWCGSEYLTHIPKKRFCSRACKDASAHAARPLMYNRSKSRLVWGHLARRDGWVCRICGEPIDPKLRAPDRMSPSADHIVPVSRGGSDDMSNLQLAHLYCNMRKHDRLVMPTSF